MSEDWLGSRVISDIQTAIQSQTVQTALERNTTDLTDQALASFLTSAPIPRFCYNAFANVSFPNGVGTTVLYDPTGSLTHDVYHMVDPTTGTLTIPIDGYYNLEFMFIGAGGGATYYQFLMQNLSLSHNVAVYVGNPPAGAATAIQISTGCYRPFKAGEKINVVFVNNTGGDATASEGHFGGGWAAPYSNYKGGGQ